MCVARSLGGVTFSSGVLRRILFQQRLAWLIHEVYLHAVTPRLHNTRRYLHTQRTVVQRTANSSGELHCCAAATGHATPQVLG